MKTIQTKFLPATNFKGARIKASDGDGNSATIPYPHEAHRGEDAHFLAYIALQDKMGWGRLGELVCCIESARGTYVWLPRSCIAHYSTSSLEQVQP